MSKWSDAWNRRELNDRERKLMIENDNHHRKQLAKKEAEYRARLKDKKK